MVVDWLRRSLSVGVAAQSSSPARLLERCPSVYAELRCDLISSATFVCGVIGIQYHTAVSMLHISQLHAARLTHQLAYYCLCYIGLGLIQYDFLINQLTNPTLCLLIAHSAHWCFTLLTCALPCSLMPHCAGLMNWMVRQSTELEVNMNAVERVVEYTKLTPEKPPIVPDQRPPSGWPSEGVITAKNLVVRYREDLDPVLKGINFSTRPHEKIGIVGRTGAFWLISLVYSISGMHVNKQNQTTSCSHSKSGHQGKPNQCCCGTRQSICALQQKRYIALQFCSCGMDLCTLLRLKMWA